MTRNITIGLRLGALLVVASFWAVPLRAQDSCDALVARAFNEFDTARRLELLMAAVDPATCPPRGRWTVGVQLLGQTLLEDGKDSLANVWLRWAVRLAPDMQPDTVQFLPRLIQAFRAARTFVARTQVPRDSAVVTSWLWPARITGESVGRLQVTTSGITDGVRMSAEGVGLLARGGSTPVVPGSYAINVSFHGSDSVRVTREVLPGVTTMLDVRLRPSFALQPETPPPAAPQQPAPHKKKFPVLWVAAGAVALGAVALLAGGGGGGGATTGGITITFPNP